MDDLRVEAVPGKQRPHAVHAQRVPVVVLDGPHDVLGDFVHVKEAQAKAAARHPANLVHRPGQAFRGEMLEQVMGEKEVVSFVGRRNLEDIARLEARPGIQGARVLHVLGAQVKAGVIHQPGQTAGLEATIIIGGATGWFEHAQRGWGARFSGQRLLPQLKAQIEAVRRCLPRALEPARDEVGQIIRHCHPQRGCGQAGKNARDVNRDFDSFGFIGPTLQSVGQRLPVLAAGKGLAHRQQPVHGHGEMELVVHEFLEAVAKEGGFAVEFKNSAWDGIFAGVESGQYDAIISSVTITEERQKKYDFSLPYLDAGQILVVPKGEKAGKLAELVGKKVGAQIGTTGAFEVKKNKGVELKTYDEVGLAFEDMVAGRIGGVVCDEPTAIIYALKKKEYADKFKIVGKAFTKEAYGIVVKKGDKELLALINKGIKAVKAKKQDGAMKAQWLK